MIERGIELARQQAAEIARLTAALYGADEALRALVNAGWSSLSEMRAIAAADECTAALAPAPSEP